MFLLQCGIHLDKPISRSGWTRRSRKRGIGFGAFDHQHGAWRASLDCRHCSHSWSWYCSHQFAWWKATHASKRWFLSWSIRPYLRGLQHVIFLILLLAINAKLCSILFRTNFKSLQSIDEKTQISSTATFLPSLKKGHDFLLIFLLLPDFSFSVFSIGIIIHFYIGVNL